MEQSSERFRNAILANMLKGIKDRGITSSSISLHERKRRIKSTADVAMALARGPSAAKWSHAILHDHHKGSGAPAAKKKKIYGKKAFKRRSSRRRVRGIIRSRRTTMAVKRKLQVLKQLVPGGEKMDYHDVVDEALDYVASLHSQLHVMRFLTGLDSSREIKAMVHHRSRQLGEGLLFQ